MNLNMADKRKPRRPLQEWEKEIPKKVERLLDELQLSKKWLAAQFGIKPAGLSPYFSGKISFKEKIPRLAEIFGKEENYFLPLSGNVESGNMPNKRMVPLISWIRAGTLHEPIDIYQAGYAEEWMASNTTGENAFALRVVGDSMLPEYKEGDIIIVDPSIEPSSGDQAVIKLGGEVAFKTIIFYMNKIVLKPINEKYNSVEVLREDGRDLQIIGKVVESYRRR